MVGHDSSVFTLDLGNYFDTSKVTSMHSMFAQVGYDSQTFTLNLGPNFDTSNVLSMMYMFELAGHNSSNFTLNLGSKFNTSNVEVMTRMFNYIGMGDADLELDLSAFDFSNVRYYTDMFAGFPSTGKIWVKDVTTQTWVINHQGSGELSTSNVLIKGA